jgi:hypothetical protein
MASLIEESEAGAVEIDWENVNSDFVQTIVD